jgi:hypothetical protein
MKSKTMVYFEPAELEALRAQARKQRISLAEAVRRAVRMSLETGGAPAKIPASAYEAIVGLGTSGRADIGEKHDLEIAKALKARRRVR